MHELEQYLPTRINEGSFASGYCLPELARRVQAARVVLPICNLGTPASQLARLADVVLPPLYREALNDELQSELVERICHCFPYCDGTPERSRWEGVLEIVELDNVPQPAQRQGGIACFSVDTAVEEHGPHLPLATDTIQSYGVLEQLAHRHSTVERIAPVEYGQLTWGLPFGLSIDITAPLLTEYVAGFARAVSRWTGCHSLYVVDVHGSIVHRTAIIDGLEKSDCADFRFRWLHDSLVEFAGERGDQHAGGVETVLVDWINPNLVEQQLWPDEADWLAAGQMGMQRAIELSDHLDLFFEVVRDSQSDAIPLNGIVGDIHNAKRLDAAEMMRRMLQVAESDLEALQASL